MRKESSTASSQYASYRLRASERVSDGLANTRRINELIVSLKEKFGVTSIVITHDLASALVVSDRIGLVQDHRIPRVVTVEEARHAPPPELAAFVSGEMEAA